MSELLPNLESLASQLDTTVEAQADALALLDAARPATTKTELDDAISVVVEAWRAP